MTVHEEVSVLIDLSAVNGTAHDSRNLERDHVDHRCPRDRGTLPTILLLFNRTDSKVKL